MGRTRSRLLALLALIPATPAAAQVSVGAPANSSNCIPFGCAFLSGVAGPPGPSTRYQQVYAAWAFPGPMSINRISFTVAIPGNLNTGRYDIYLSTTPKVPDGLSTTFADDVGADNTLLGSFALTGGPAPTTLSFTGNTFDYDPAGGSLLLDILTSISGTPPGPSFACYQSRDFVPGAISGTSRMHDFGVGNEGFGLVTTFDFVGATAAPEPATLALVGAGLLAVGRLARRRRSA